MATTYELVQPMVAGTAYQFWISLVSQADTDLFQTSVTLAAGDVQWSKDGAAFANVTNLPTEIGTTGALLVSLTAAETTGITKFGILRCRDAAGDEWQDLLVLLPVYQAVTISPLDAAGVRSAVGLASANLDTQLSLLATAAALATVDANVDAVLLDTGTDGVVVASIGTGAITADAIAANAITSSELATSAAQEIADELLKRGVDNVEDSADATSLAALVLAAFESVISDTTWTIYKTDHSTTFTTRTVTTDSNADPIVEVT